jgi:hypothetical protein
MLIAHGESQSMGVELQDVTDGQPNIQWREPWSEEETLKKP